MMLLVAVGVLQAVSLPAQAGVDPTSADDVVVIARRLRDLRVQTKRNRATRAMECTITKSSGDLDLDRLACAAALPCSEAADTIPQFKACFFPRVGADAKAMYAMRRARSGRAE